VNVALVIVVDGAVVTKSSAVSVSSLPGLAVRERVAILPSGLPVLKKNTSARAGGVASPRARSAIKGTPETVRIAKLLGVKGTTNNS
jgi:hypothetical protein